MSPRRPHLLTATATATTTATTTTTAGGGGASDGEPDGAAGGVAGAAGPVAAARLRPKGPRCAGGHGWWDRTGVVLGRCPKPLGSAVGPHPAGAAAGRGLPGAGVAAPGADRHQSRPGPPGAAAGGAAMIPSRIPSRHHDHDSGR